MTLKNISKKTIVSSDLKVAMSTLDKTMGLLKKSNPRSMIFETRFGIHTFFMEKPIDVLILDDTYKVCVIKESLAPNRVFVYSPKFKYVVELPQGIIDKSKTSLGDRLQIIDGRY